MLLPGIRVSGLSLWYRVEVCVGGLYTDMTPMMENQMKNEMQTVMNKIPVKQ